MTRYALLVNPKAGKVQAAIKSGLLPRVAKVFKAEVAGLDTLSQSDFLKCAKDLSEQFDVVVVAGGDGTFSDVINAVDTRNTCLAFLPFGTGNALKHALKYKGGILNIARQIATGRIYKYDLIDCDQKQRGFMVSLGLEGQVLDTYERYKAAGQTGLMTYVKAALSAFFKEYEPAASHISINGKSWQNKRLLSLVIVKQPYYGFGMKVVPQARFDDGMLHILEINSDPVKLACGAFLSFTIGNRLGKYHQATKVQIKTSHPLMLQIDGDKAYKADSFCFELIPKALKMKH